MSAWLGQITPVVSALVPVMLGIIGLVRYRMRLQFLRHVYDRNPRDLKAAGKVSESRGLTSGVRRRIRGRQGPHT